MVETARTTATLLAGAVRVYDLAHYRDAIVSGPQWDVIGGAAAPAILRGTWDGGLYFRQNGGVTGDMTATPSQRATNGTVLNALMSAAASNGKIVELPPDLYEINNSTGIVIPAGSGFVFRGSRGGTIISQFYTGGTGAPVVDIGDHTGATETVAIEFEGAWLRYGASQAGLTSSSALRVNAAPHSRIGCIGLGGPGLSPAYNNLLLDGGPTFSTSFYDINTGQAQQNQLLVNVVGTGNTFDNIYLNNGGTGVFNALGGSYIAFSGSITNEMTFTQLNCEWGACNKLMDLQSMIGLKFVNLHVEGIQFTGAGPCVFNTANSSITWDTCNFVDLFIQSAHMTGALSVMLDYNASSSVLKMRPLNWINNASGQINMPVLLFSPSGGTLGQDTSVVEINGGFFRDYTFSNAELQPHIQFDVHMPVTSSTFLCPMRFDRYEWGSGGSVLNKPVYYPIAANYTHYGQQQGATLIVDASITGFTITLAATMGATGTEPVATGTIVHVRRETGSASGTLLVKDDAGTTLTTNTTSGQDFFYRFNGTHYVTFTQVT
jgi:hypothetical protein